MAPHVVVRRMLWAGPAGRVAVTTESPGGLDARVSDSLEEASTITVVDPITWEVEVVHLNPGESDPGHVARALRGAGAHILITGLASPVAAAELARSGVWVLQGMGGLTAREAVEAAAGASTVGPLPYSMPPAPPQVLAQFPARHPIPAAPRPPEYVIERQREILEFQRWVLQRQLEILDKQREILQRQLLMVKKVLDKLGEA